MDQPNYLVSVSQSHNASSSTSSSSKSSSSSSLEEQIFVQQRQTSSSQNPYDDYDFPSSQSLIQQAEAFYAEHPPPSQIDLYRQQYQKFLNDTSRQRIEMALQSKSIDTRDEETMLTLDAVSLSDMAQIDRNTATEYLDELSYSIRIKVPRSSALAMRRDPNQSRCVSLGCSIIDSFLCGGFPCGIITELVGESATGKSTLAMQACLYSQLSTDDTNANSRSITACYINTENTLQQRGRRFQQMATEFVKQNQVKFNPLERAVFSQVSTIEKLFEYLTKDVVELFKKHRLKLLVIDSIAGLIRGTEIDKDLKNRSVWLWNIANQLKLIAHTYNVPVVVVNHITGSAVATKLTYPALGQVWSNAISTRLSLEKTSAQVPIEYDANELQTPNKRNKRTIAGDDDDEQNENNNYIDDDGLELRSEPSMRKATTTVRRMTVSLATNLPSNTSVKYIIDTSGIKGLQYYG